MPVINQNSKKFRRKKQMSSLKEGVDSTEYYLGKYAKENDKTEYYAKNNKNDEIYLEDVNGRPIKYAQKEDENNERFEFVAKMANGEPIYMTDQNEELIYPINISRNEPIFPTDNEDGSNSYRFYRGKEFYAKDLNGDPIYVLNAEGKVKFAKDGSEFYYAKNRNGDEVYPKDAEGNEVYLSIENRDVGAKKSSGTFFYAKDKNGREMYPKQIVIENDEAEEEMNME